jgi:hypothetical protein
MQEVVESVSRYFIIKENNITEQAQLEIFRKASNGETIVNVCWLPSSNNVLLALPEF